MALTGAQRHGEALVWATRAESALADTNARVIRSSAAAVRANALASTGHLAEAEAEAARSIALYRRNSTRAFSRHHPVLPGPHAEAEAHLDVALAAMPGDSLMIAMRERVRTARRQTGK